MSKTTCRLLPALAVLMLLSTYAAAQSRASVTAAEVNGTYEMRFPGKFKEFSNEVKILALGRGKIRIAFDLIYPYLMSDGETMVNMGQLDDVAAIEGDTAIYTGESGKCRIRIKFVKPGTIAVAEESTGSACGFGHNVSASGTYKKISGKKPRFEEQSR